jgi:uncharacterized protein (DUF1778 family)
LNRAPKRRTPSQETGWRRQMPRSASAHSERLNLRLDATAKRRIEQAASFEGKTVSGFIVSSALASAERTIREHETIALSRRDAEAFLEAIVAPPKPNEKLFQALEEHRRRVVSR